MALHPTILTPLLLSILLATCQAVTFDVINKCAYTVWGAASPGGGQQLDPGASWSFNVADGTSAGRIWGRTGCSFDSNGQNGQCQTGDCGGVLACTGYGFAPNTLAEYALDRSGGLDYFDISLVDGFNLPLDFLPTSNGCSSGPKCDAVITPQCPGELRAAGGCNSPCAVFQTDEYCCTSGSCGPTSYSEFFKNLCPDAYSYPRDTQNVVYTCPGNTNYQVTFCP